MPDLDTLLQSIPNTGEGVVPDNSASAGSEVPEGNSGENITLQPAPEVTDDKNIRDTEVQEPEKTTESEDLVEKIKAASVDQEGDSAVIKEMRSLLRERLDKLPQQEGPSLSAEQEEAIALVNDLYSFDVENAQPTTRGFVDKLASKDVNLVNQLVFDAINVPVENPEINGWTIGHELLKRIGLDPMRLDELKQFSRGEIQLPQYGESVEVPDFIPEQYHEAYKSLNETLRNDVDTYLQSVKQDHKVAALHLLQSTDQNLKTQKAEEARVANEQQSFNDSVNTDVDSELITTYTGVLDSIKESSVYNDIKISSIPEMDAMMKDSLISQINALGDDNTVLKNRAVEFFNKIDVKIDIDKVQGILNEIKTNTEISIKAKKLGEIQKRDYSSQIQQALTRRSTAVARAIALGNDYFSQALSKLSQAKLPDDIDINETDPLLQGGRGGKILTESRTNGILTPEQLDSLVLGTAEGIRKGAS